MRSVDLISHISNNHGVYATRSWQSMTCITLPLDTPPVLQESPPLLVLVDIDIAVRVHPDGMTAIDLSGPGRARPAGEGLPLERQEGDQTVQFRNIYDLVRIDIDVAGAREASPLGQELALRGKDLDTVILSVRHQHPAIGMHPDPVRHMELARGGLTRGPPRQ